MQSHTMQIQEEPSEADFEIHAANNAAKLTGAIIFAKTFVDDTIFVADTIDTIFSLAPQLLSFSYYGVGAGVGISFLLALAESYCHLKDCQVNQPPQVPLIPKNMEDKVKIGCKYKLPLAGHMLADMFDYAGLFTVLAKTFFRGNSSLTLNIASKILGGFVGVAYSYGESSKIYQSFKRLTFWEARKAQVTQTNIKATSSKHIIFRQEAVKAQPAIVKVAPLANHAELSEILLDTFNSTEIRRPKH